MNDYKFTIAQAQEIRRMAKQGYEIKNIQTKLKIGKQKLIEILDVHYSKNIKNNILSILKLNEKNKNNDNIQEEVIVIDTSYLVSSIFEDVESFLTKNKNSVIPGPVIEELHKNSKDTNKNFISRRIVTILLELDTKVEISDDSIQLDPTWLKNKDYYILTVCAKLKNKGLSVKLLSFDKEMLLKARGLGIERYYMDFPQDNVKHCETYLLDKCKDIALIEEPLVVEETVAVKELAVDNELTVVKEEKISKKSLLALKNKFSNNPIHEINKTIKIKKQQPLNYYKKEASLNNINADQSQPEILKIDGIVRLVDSSSVDIFMGILKTAITSNGKSKKILTDEKSLYYNIDCLDKILIFTKLSNYTIEMKIGNINENGNFIIEKTEMLQEGCMKKINKKYHESIKEAYIKLLKVKLNKVS